MAIFRMKPKYKNAQEEAVHAAAIQALADELRRPAHEIRQRYETELAVLQEGARIREFLSVCATRHTRERFRHAHRGPNLPAKGDQLVRKPASPAG